MRRLLIPALLMVGSLPLFAHSGHVILASQVTTTTVEYEKGYKATWRAEVVDADQKLIKYTLTLERPGPEIDDGKKPISLYNLRLQGRIWTVRVAHAPGIKFYPTFNDARLKTNPISKDPKTDQWLIPYAATHHSQGDLDAKEDRVAMLVWERDGSGTDNTCEIVVYSDRKVRGPLSKLSKGVQAKEAKFEVSLHPLENHHSEPPPGTPGGEEGESSN